MGLLLAAILQLMFSFVPCESTEASEDDYEYADVVGKRFDVLITINYKYLGRNVSDSSREHCFKPIHNTAHFFWLSENRWIIGFQVQAHGIHKPS